MYVLLSEISEPVLHGHHEAYPIPFSPAIHSGLQVKFGNMYIAFLFVLFYGQCCRIYSEIFSFVAV